MSIWRWTIALLAAGLALAAVGAWAQGFLPQGMPGDVLLLWLASVLPACAVAWAGGSRGWLIASVAMLLAPFVASHHWLAVLMLEARRGGAAQLGVPALFTAIVLAWPLAVLSYATWLGRRNRASIAGGWRAWQRPCAAACLIVFGGFQAFAFFPEYTVRRVGAWRTIEQRVRAAVAAGQRLAPIEPVTFPFMSRPTIIRLVTLTPEPLFTLEYGPGRTARFDLQTLVCQAVDD
jgi:hypothetical protein